MRAAWLYALLAAVSVVSAQDAPQAPQGGASAPPAQAPQTLEGLLATVKAAAATRSEQDRAREQRFLAARDQQRAMVQEVERALAQQNARSAELKAKFDANETELAAETETLQVRIGNMGELFGVVRQVAGDAKGIVDTSLVSAQLSERGELASRLAQAKGLPSMEDLKDLYVLLLEEMTESGRVVRFNTDVVNPDGKKAATDVVRVGTFNAIAGDRFLYFEPQDAALHVLARQPARRFRSLAAGLASATEGIVPMALDPSRGTILSLLIQAPSLMERVRQGGLVGYTIIALAIIGMLIALERLIALARAGRGIRAQLKSERVDEGNALGRILKVYEDHKSADNETLALKLDEAVLREVPVLEKWQGWIKVLAAIAPLLGLLGTVVGMIITFQAITLFGTGDPKLMAGGISTALVTTVQGLVAAIPLVLLHSLVASRSRMLVEILEEQSAGIIARHSEASRSG
jgi:biopolymer transport protein ExbB